MTHTAHRMPRAEALARRGAAIAIGLLALAFLLFVTQGRAAAAQTVVSIQFDDGVSSQYQVRDTLSAHGMDATFYINSALIGDEDHMSWAQLHTLADDGNEIGGHTLDHPHLTQLTAQQQRDEICQDRAALQAQGFTVTNFAYPFGDFDATTQSIVGDCGYDTGRGVSGIVSPNGCFNCDFAETIPPQNRLATRTPQNPQSTTTLADLQGYVTQAEQHGGGWVQVVFHEVCDGCDQYSTPLSEISQFLDWLQPRAANGTVVKTTAQVVATPAEPPPDPATNLLPNPSLEADANNDQVPDCWLLGGFGTNTFSWARTTDAHSGGFAERSTITAYTDGDRKLVTLQDAGACAPSAVPGHAYSVQAWAKRTAPARLVVYYRGSDGLWTFFAQGPLLPANSGYELMSMTTPAVPAGATNLSVGISLRDVGSVTGDDYYLGDAGGGATDTTDPGVSLTAPAAGATLTGTATLTADASDNAGVARVEFLVDDQIVGSDTTAPYAYDLNTTTLTDGPHTITARAVDTSSNSTTSAGTAVAVDNSVAPPAAYNLLQNPSLETGGAPPAGLPDCFQIGGSGNNTFTSGRVNDAHSGSWAERVTITAFTDGDRRILSRQDTGACAPVAVPGHRYLVRAYYKSTAPVRLVAYYRSSAGVWTFFTQGAVVPASAGYTAVQMTTPVVPAGATHLSIGISLRAVGQVTGDDFHLSDADQDRGGPTTAMTAPATGALVSGQVDLAATASDDIGVAKVEFLVDDQVVGTDTGAPYTTTIDSTTLADGPHTVRSRATDTSNNVALGDPITITVDNGAPTVALSTPAAGALVHGSAALAAVATDSGGVDHVDFLVDDQVAATDASDPYSANIDTTTLADGPHAIRARAVDRAGHVTLGDPVTVTVNNTGPTAGLTAPVANATLSGSADLTATASDANGVDHVEFLIDDQVAGTDASDPYAATVDTTTLTDGAHSVRVRAQDAAGNVTTGPAVAVTVRNAPAVALTAPAAAALLRGSVPLAATASASAVRVEFLVDGAVVATDTTDPYTATLDTTTLTDGAHALRARAVDGADRATLGDPVSVTVDNTGPTTALTAPAANATLAGTAGFTATATDASGIDHVDFLVDDQVVGTDASAPYAASFNTTTLPDGPHTVRVRAQDTAGNVTTANAVPVTIRNTAPAPTVALTAPAAGAILRGSVTLTATASGSPAVARVEFLLDGAVVATDTSSPYSVSLNTATRSDGTHALQARAVNTAGTAATTTARNVMIDNTAATSSIQCNGAPCAAWYTTTPVSVTLSATDGAGSGVAAIRYTTNGTSPGTSSPAYTAPFNVTGSSTTVRFRAYDVAGNAEAIRSQTIRIDTSKPSVVISSPSNGSTVSGTVTVRALASDSGSGVQSVSFYRDAGVLIGTDTAGLYRASWATGSLTKGNHTIYAVAKDVAGNTTTSSVITVRVA